MKPGAKIAISLPEHMLEQIEAERQTTGETRSEFIRRAVTALLRAEDEQRAIDRYIEGYRKHPETPEEVAAASVLESAVLNEVPWDAEELREAG